MQFRLRQRCTRGLRLAGGIWFGRSFRFVSQIVHHYTIPLGQNSEQGADAPPIHSMADYHWILFDSTGTLMTPDPEPAQVYQSVAAGLGVRQSVADVRQSLKEAMARHFFGDTVDQPTDEWGERARWRRIVADTLGDLSAEQVDSAYDTLWNHFASFQAWRLYDDVVPTLTRLKQKGYSIAVASNFDIRLRWVIEGMGIADQFDEVLISSDLGWSKPNTRFYDAVTGRLNHSDRSRMLMIGDTQAGDVDAARNAGLDARLLVREGPDALVELTRDL